MKALDPLQPLLTLPHLFSANAITPTSHCRSLPGDPSYPTAAQWTALNTTVGAPCHDPQYDAAACQAVRAGWTLPAEHCRSSSSVMAGVWANGSCDPFAAREEAACELGRFVDWADEHYMGKAVKVGAGVQYGELYEAADAEGYLFVGGTCPTVGVAGGYVQGGGTFGVVVSMVSKVHSDLPVAAANITIPAAGLDLDKFWSAEITATAYILNTSFAVSPINAPGLGVEELGELLQPYFDELDASGIGYQKFVGDFPGYWAEHQVMQPLQLVGTSQGAHWLIPKAVVDTRNDELTAAYRSVTDEEGIALSLAMNASKALEGNMDNSVNPACRNAVMLGVVAQPVNITGPWADMLAVQNTITDKFLPRLKSVAPDSGSYFNEMSRLPRIGLAKRLLWSNYPELLKVKARYDPDGLFYGLTAVGS